VRLWRNGRVVRMQQLPAPPQTPGTVPAQGTPMETPGLAERAQVPYHSFGEPPVRGPTTLFGESSTTPSARTLVHSTPQRAALVARLEHLEAQLEARGALSDAPSRHDFELFQLLRNMEQRVEQFQAQIAQQIPQLVGEQVQSATGVAHAHLQSALEHQGAQLHAAVQQTVSQTGAQVGETMRRMQEAVQAQAQALPALPTAPPQATSSLPPLGPYSGMEEDPSEGPSGAKPVNPRLPAYEGDTDPHLWLRQADVLFRANGIPLAQQGVWLVAALRGAAARFWHFECAEQSYEAGNVAQLLKRRFRPFAYEYGLDSQLNTLRMQPGGYQRFADSFSETVAQLQSKSPEDVLYAFLRGLTQEYRQHVLLQGAPSYQQAQEICRRLDLASRQSHHGPPSSLAKGLRFYDNRSGRPGLRTTGGRDRAFSRERSTTPSWSRTPRSASQPSSGRRSTTPQTPRQWQDRRKSQSPARTPAMPKRMECFHCGKPGHFAKDCWLSRQSGSVVPNPGAHKSPQHAAPSGRGRGRAFQSPRGRGFGRGRAQGNSSR
jgi:hypothetical protein